VPERFVARLLGMGDIETLLRRIEETIKIEKMERIETKAVLTGKLTLRDVYDQLEAMSKMGPLKKLLQMIPGFGFAIPEDQIRIGEEKLKKFKVIMQSMTPEELENPRILNASRIRRVARGSGTSEADVKELLKQYELVRRLIKTLAKGRTQKLGPLAKLIKQLPKEIS
jgi:signal recognition particle subunit SRP54